jgi:hypothetical protein
VGVERAEVAANKLLLRTLGASRYSKLNGSPGPQRRRAWSFSAVRKLMGNEITVEYTLTIDGDKFKGKGAAEFGGQKQEFDINGKREKKDK